MAHIVSVVSDGSDTVRFTFDTQVTATADISGFNVLGSDATADLTSYPSFDVAAQFPNPSNPGDPWVFSEPPAGLTFSPPKTIGSASGTTS